MSFYRLRLLFSSSAAFAKFEITLSLSAHYPSVPLSFSIQNHLGNIGWVKDPQERVSNHFFSFVIFFDITKWLENGYIIVKAKCHRSLTSFWRICSFKISDLHCYIQWLLETFGLFFNTCSTFWNSYLKEELRRKKTLHVLSPKNIWTSFIALKTELSLKKLCSRNSFLN